MVPGSLVFLGTLVIAALIGGWLPSELLRMIAALVIFAVVLIEHVALRLMAANGGVYVTGWLVFIAVMALTFGLGLGVAVRLVAHSIKLHHISRIALATLVTLILDVGLAVLVLP